MNSLPYSKLSDTNREFSARSVCVCTSPCAVRYHECTGDSTCAVCNNIPGNKACDKLYGDDGNIADNNTARKPVHPKLSLYSELKSRIRYALPGCLKSL